MLYYNPDSLVLNKKHGELGEKTKSIFNPYMATHGAYNPRTYMS